MADWSPPTSDVMKTDSWQPPATDVADNNQQPWYQSAADTIQNAEKTVTPKAISGALGKISSQPEMQPIQSIVPSIPKGNPVQQVLGSMRDIAGAPFRFGQTLMQAPDIAGEAANDFGASQGYPLTGAAVGTAIKMLPAAATAYGGWEGIHNIPSPTLQGLLNTPKELGPRYTAIDSKAGVSGDLPVQRGNISKFPGLDGTPQNAPPIQTPNVAPTIYPKDTNTYLNFVRNRIANLGKEMTPQELADHDSMLSSLMGKMQVNNQGQTPVFAKAAQAHSDITAIRNAIVPGRADLNTSYGIAKTQEQLGPLVKKYLSNAAKVGGTIGGVGSGAYELWKYLNGNRDH
jgi:hypothetical protein